MTDLLSTNFIKLTTQIHSKIHSGKTEFTNEDKLASIVKISEELGELADQVLGSIKHQRVDKNNSIEELEGEFADVIMSTIMLAHTYKIDINTALENKLKIIKKRFGIE